jgi:hypothetical protein
MILFVCKQDTDRARRFEFLLKQTGMFDTFLKGSKNKAVAVNAASAKAAKEAADEE